MKHVYKMMSSFLKCLSSYTAYEQSMYSTYKYIHVNVFGNGKSIAIYTVGRFPDIVHLLQDSNNVCNLV